MKKAIIYSVLPRLWGNQTKDLKQNGTFEENGSGKLSAFDDKALNYIKSLGCNYVWYIGLLEHSTTTSFDSIKADPSEIVKGKAGSPYSVKDYYDVAPSLSDRVEERQQEFDALVKRTHKAGLGFLMDFIPNHLARTYCSDVMPKGVENFGTKDKLDQTFDRDNNFYYLPNEELHLPTQESSYKENPARATGNDYFSAYPSQNDWYETVKLNYGVDYLSGQKEHFEPIPDTWHKMYEVLSYWAGRGVDGFRCDMAELVPPAFWAWVIPKLKKVYTNLLFLAEIYQPHRYNEYLSAGFDYLYDKVGMYDTMRAIIRGEAEVLAFDRAMESTAGFQDKMCYFLENHDEQRLPSDFFASKDERGYPALASLVFSGTNPFLLYFGQELGEEGMQAEGFSGLDGRTTIFDYWALDKVQRLQADDYKGTKLSNSEQNLLAEYRKLLNLVHEEKAFSQGAYYGLNYTQDRTFKEKRCLTYVRYVEGEYILFVANFSEGEQSLELNFPKEFFFHTELKENSPLNAEDLISGNRFISTLTSLAPFRIELEALGIRVIRFRKL